MLPPPVTIGVPVFSHDESHLPNLQSMSGSFFLHPHHVRPFMTLHLVEHEKVRSSFFIIIFRVSRSCSLLKIGNPEFKNPQHSADDKMLASHVLDSAFIQFLKFLTDL